MAGATATAGAVGSVATAGLLTLGEIGGLARRPFEAAPPLSQRGALIAEGLLRGRPGLSMGGPRWQRREREDGPGHFYVDALGLAVQTGPSDIAGTGVFAMERMAPGTKFGLDGLEVLRRKTAKAAGKASEGNEYAVLVQDPDYHCWIVYDLMGVAETSPWAYANSPVGTADKEGSMQLRMLGGMPTLELTREVSPGEELTWDYGSGHRLALSEEREAEWHAACEAHYALYADVRGGTQSSGEMYSPTRD